MKYRIFEHTADLGIEAFGDDAGEALAQAAQALSEVVTGNESLHAHRPDGELAFHVTAPDRDALAVAFLSELLWFLESESMLWLSGGVEVAEGPDGWTARAQGNGAVYRPERHGQGVEVKAVTYHDLAFGPAQGRWRARVLLDI